MRTKTALKAIEVLKNAELKPEQALGAKLKYVMEILEMEIITNQRRQATIRLKKVMGDGKQNNKL